MAIAGGHSSFNTRINKQAALQLTVLATVTITAIRKPFLSTTACRFIPLTF
jgi:hypothetical protein